MVFHDATLERTTNGLGRVVEHRLDELKSLDAGSWFSRRFKDEPIPTLEEALTTIASLGMGVNIEIKPDPENAKQTAQLALQAARRVWPNSAPSPLISSFDDEALTAAAALCHDWPIGLLAEAFEPRLLTRAAQLRAASLNLDEKAVSSAQIDEIHRAGFAVLAYTVNDPARADQLWGLGVDALFTDDPKALRRSERID
ncbi:Glycerophosphodiester phosphodiesterase (fragment) [Rhodospirillaceae bacterium LM-1]